MSFTALYDTCVLYPRSVRDLLVRLAQDRPFCRPLERRHLDEMVESILERQPKVDRSRLERTRQLTCEAVPDCLITGYERLIEGLQLRDADDEHDGRGEAIREARRQGLARARQDRLAYHRPTTNTPDEETHDLVHFQARLRV